MLNMKRLEKRVTAILLTLVLLLGVIRMRTEYEHG